MDRRRFRVIALAAAVIFATSAGVWAKPTLPIRKSKVVSTVRKTPPVQPVNWQHDLKTAQRFSVATGRPMLIVFCASWCTNCKNLETETIGQASIANYINATFIPVHLDLDKERRTARILEVKSLPTCIILSPQADLLGIIEGYVKADEFAQVLRQSVDFQRTLEVERTVAARRRK